MVQEIARSGPVQLQPKEGYSDVVRMHSHCISVMK
jgi:hypothetical protein